MSDEPTLVTLRVRRDILEHKISGHRKLIRDAEGHIERWRKYINARLDTMDPLEDELEDILKDIAELEDTNHYVQVRFLNSRRTPYLWTYIDPTGLCEVGDFVITGEYNGVAQVVKIGKGDYEGPYKNIKYRLVWNYLA